MLILDLTVSVKPKKVLEWKYFILPSILFVNSQMIAMSKCLDSVVCGVIEP